MMRLVLIFLCFFHLASSAQAILWFKKDPIDRSPARQTEEARPIYQKALEYQRDGKQRKALSAYREVFRKYPASDFAAQALYNSGVIYFERQKWRKSFQAFQTILAYHADFPLFNELVGYQFRIAIAQSEGDGIRFLFVFPYKALNQAVEYFEIIIGNAPYSDYAPISLMNVALIHQYKGQTIEAIDALDRLINNYPGSLLTDDAYLNLAETFAQLVQGPDYDQGATREAISYFEDFLILYAENEAVARAEKGLEEMEDVYARSKFVIGQYYFEHRRWYEAAEIFFNEAITTAPESDAAAAARKQIESIAAIRENRAPVVESAPSQSPKEKSFIKRLLERVIPGK
jgi:outer membrane protein assembly factor BamD